MIRYIVATIFNVAFTLLAYVLAPLVALFTKSDGYLPNWLAWFQTQDASLDAGWKDLYFVSAVPTNPPWRWKWWMRTRWLWRNPAYGFCYWPLGIAYNPSDWVIDSLTHDGTTLTELKAHTTDGKHFAYTSSSGGKYGFKLWWALDEDFKLIAKLPDSRGPDNRLPTAFTPSL